VPPTLFDAAFAFTVGRRWKRESSDTLQSWRNMPLFHFATVADLREHLPHSCPLVGVELHPKAHPLASWKHPERACYLLGAEDHGLTAEEIAECHTLIVLPGRQSMNVACAGSVILYDRFAKSRALSDDVARFDVDLQATS